MTMPLVSLSSLKQKEGLNVELCCDFCWVFLDWRCICIRSCKLISLVCPVHGCMTRSAGLSNTNQFSSSYKIISCIFSRGYSLIFVVFDFWKLSAFFSVIIRSSQVISSHTCSLRFSGRFLPLTLIAHFLIHEKISASLISLWSLKYFLRNLSNLWLDSFSLIVNCMFFVEWVNCVNWVNCVKCVNRVNCVKCATEGSPDKSG